MEFKEINLADHEKYSEYSNMPMPDEKMPVVTMKLYSNLSMSRRYSNSNVSKMKGRDSVKNYTQKRWGKKTIQLAVVLSLAGCCFLLDS